MPLVQTAQGIAVLTGFVAALSLFYGSIGVPPKMQSWKAGTPQERRWRLRQATMKWIGIPAATVSATCQLAVIFWLTN